MDAQDDRHLTGDLGDRYLMDAQDDRHLTDDLGDRYLMDAQDDLRLLGDQVFLESKLLKGK